MAKKNNLQPTFNLLEDTPLDYKKESKLIRFGHEEIAKALFSLIKVCNPPTVLGLYGKWGTGKTTIIEIIRGLIEDEKSDLKVVYFDVWKHDKDSLRRQFILEAALQIAGKGYRDSLKKRIELDTTNSEQSNYKFHWLRAFLVFAFVFTVVFSFLKVFPLQEIQKVLGENVKNEAAAGYAAFLASVLSISLELVKTIFGAMFTKKEVSFHKQKITNGDEFEHEFKEILKETKSKVLFVFDNLDRVNASNAVTVLATIKSFLEHEQCVFLVPCDEDSIKRQVEEAYLSNGNADPNEAREYADEFLRKFFSANLYIPLFDGVELDSYTTELLKKTKITEFKNNSHLVWLITYSFRSNPRQIKQFINSLVAAIQLIRERTRSGEVKDKKFSELDIAFIAKILIIKQKFSKDYEELENKLSKNSYSWNDFFSEKQSNKNGLREFLEETEYIVPESRDLQFFITYKQSSDEQILPGWTRYLTAALNRDEESAKKVFTEFEKNSLATFDTVSSSYIEKNKTNDARITPFISTTMSVIDGKELALLPKLSTRICTVLPNKLSSATLKYFPINFARTEAEAIEKQTISNKLMKSYLGLLTNENSSNSLDQEQEDSLLLDFSENTSFYKPIHKEIEAILITTTHGTYNNLEIFNRHPDSKKLLTIKVLRQFIARLDSKLLDSETDLEKNLDLIVANFFNDRTFLIEFIKKITSFSSLENTVGPRKQRTQLLVTCTKLFDMFSEPLHKIDAELKELIKSLVGQLLSWYSQWGDWEHRSALFGFSRAIYDFADDDTKTNLHSHILAPYLREVDFHGVRLLKNADFEFAISNVDAAAKEVILRDVRNVDLFEEFISPQMAHDIVINAKSRQTSSGLDYLEKLGDEIDNPDDVLRRFYHDFDTLGLEEKNKIIALTNPFKKELSEGLRQMIFDSVSKMPDEFISNFLKERKGYLLKEQNRTLREQVRKNQKMQDET